MTIDASTDDLSRAVKLCEREATDPRPSRRLTAGRLTVELENGQLRYVALAGVEALRRIAFLGRDENWGTYAPQIEKLEIEEGAGASRSAIGRLRGFKGKGSSTRRGYPARAPARSPSPPSPRRRATS
jgi:hypothetical protein